MATLSAIYRISADISGLQSGIDKGVAAIDRIEKKNSAMMSGLSKVGSAMAAAFTVTAVVAAGNEIISFASHLTDLAAKTGLSTTALQKLGLVFEESGIDIDSVTTAAVKMQKLLGDDDKSLVNLVGKLGLSFAMLKRMAPEEAFFAVADAIGKIPNQNEKALASTIAFGKGGMAIMAGLNGHLQETSDHFESLGLIIDEKTVKAADDFGDQIKLMGKQLLALMASVLAPLLPLLSALGSVLLWIGQKVIGPILNVAVKSLLTILGLLWEGLLNFLATLADIAQKIPFLGKYLGFLGDAADFLRKKADATSEFVGHLWDSTEGAGNAAAVATPKLLGLGRAVDESGKAIQSLQDMLTAADMAKKADELSRAWAGLTDVQKENGHNMVRLVDAYEPLRKSLEPSQMPANLEALRAEFLKVPYALDLIEHAMGNVTEAAKLLPFSRRDDVQIVRDYLTALAKVSAIQITPLSGPVPALPLLGPDPKGKLGLNKTIRDSLKSLMQGDVSQVFKDLGGFFERGAGQIGVGFLRGIGNSLVGGLTSLLTSGLGAVWHGIDSLFGKLTSREGKQVNDLRDKFQAGFGPNGVGGSLDDMNRAFQKVGLTVDRVLHVGKVKDFQAAIDEFNKALQFQNDALKEFDDTVKEYGIDIGSMGAAAQTRLLTQSAEDLYRKFKVLTGGGIETSVALKAMSTDLLTLIQNAMQFGIALPEQFRIIVQGLIDQGLLLDANGKAFTDLTQTGLTFGGTMQDTFDRMTDAINNLVAAIRLGLGLGLSEAEQQARNLKNTLDQLPSGSTPGYIDFVSSLIKNRNDLGLNDPVPMAAGGAGIVNRPTLFMAGESGPEEFAFSGANRTFGSSSRPAQPLVVNLHLDGRLVTSQVIDDVLQDKRGAGTKLRRGLAA